MPFLEAAFSGSGSRFNHGKRVSGNGTETRGFGWNLPALTLVKSIG